MKNYSNSIGIDISKKTLDVALHLNKLHQVFENNAKGFKSLLSWLKKSKVSTNSSLFCFEHTGWYCLELSWFLEDRNLSFHCAHPLHLKRSLGFRRGKSDKADAFDIAHYAWTNREELALTQAPTRKLIDLQRMLSLREQFVKQSTGLKNHAHAMKQIVKKIASDPAFKVTQNSLGFLKKQQLKIEKQMEDMVHQLPELSSNYSLLKSIKGIGLVLALQIIVHTHNFSRFDNWRQFSAYCGLAPYPYQSGTSIKRSPKTHPICDKQMKSLLSMAAISAIQTDPELKRYYQRRVAEGKNKMSVINIIRSKIVARAFAVTKRQTPFVEMAKFAA